MANNDVVNLIIGQEAFEQTGKLDKALQSNYNNLLKLYELSQKVGKGNFSSGVTTQKNSLKQLADANEQVNALLKEQDRLEKGVISTIAKKQLATESTNRTLIKEREELKAVNLQIRNQERANSRLVGAYAQLTARLNLVRREYKNVAVSEGEASDKAIRLRKELEKLDARVKSVDASAGQFQRNVGNYPEGVTGIQQLAGSAKNLIRNFVGAFGAVEGLRLAWDFAKESLEVARQAKGVEFAFNRLGERGTKAFEDIKKATRGTLSDLDIKKSINEFDNLGISLETSGVAFEFLAVRAAQTGKSVESMKEDLVTGLGRGSVRILDNLGLSMSELNKLTKEQGLTIQEAFGVIAQKEIEKAGDILDKSANDTEKWAAALENVQVKFGKFLNTGNIGLIGLLAEQMNKLADSFDVIDDGIDTAETALTRFLKPFKELTSNVPILNKAFSSTNGVFSKFIDFLTTPGLEVFGNFLKDVSYRLAGVGGVINEVINRFKAFKKELLDLSSLDFTSPIALFNSLQNKFNNIVSESTDFTIAYKKAQIELAFALAKSKEEQEQINDLNIKTNTNTKETTELLKEKKKILEDTMSLYDYIANKQSEIVNPEDVANEFGVDENIESPSFEDSIDSFANFFGFDPEMMLKAWKDYVERMEKIGEEATLNGFFNDLKEGFTESDKQLRELASQTASELVNTTNAIFDNKIQRYDDDIQRNDDYYAKLLDNEQLTEEQRSQLEAERDAKNAQLEKKKREEQRKQAIFNKVISLAEIGINTAQAVTKNIAQLGLLPAIPVNALTIALGAAQAATVAATPIPRYRTGKKKGQGSDGLALVNDGGRDEIKVGADGTVTRYSGRNVLDYVKQDDTIYPSVGAFENQMLKRSLSLNFTNKKGSDIDRAIIGVRSEVKQGIKEGFKGVRLNVNNTIKTSSRDAYIASKMH